MLKLILYIIGFGLAVFAHDTLITAGLNLRLPFTFAKITPYVIEFLFVCLIIYEVYITFLKDKVHWIRRIVSMVILFGLCGIAFALHPIYDGDFNNKYNVIYLSGESTTAFNPGLTMVALPGCPYCHQRLEEMNFVSKIYPDLPINVYVVGKDSTVLEAYRKTAIETIHVEMFPPHLLMNKALNPGVYPTMFHQSQGNTSELKRWTNDGFGTGAWDFVIKEK